MRIAYVLGGLPFGGVESWLLDLCLALRQEPDVEAHVVNVSGTGVRHQAYLDAGIAVHSVGSSTRCLASHRLDTALGLRRLLRDQVKPDLVHTLHFSGNYFGRLACLGLGLPVLVNLRNVKRERSFHRLAADKLLSYATDKYLCVSQGVAETVRLDHNLAGRPVQVLYNAVDLDKLDVEPADLSAFRKGGERVLLAVGRLVPQKNYLFLLEVFAKVLESCPDTVLFILGEGGRRQELEQAVERLGLAGRAFLPGYREDVPAWMRAADLFVMPSLFEGLPISHLEAMGCGLPAVISEHVPSKEIAGDCALVAHLDRDEFARAVARLLTEDDAYQAMSRAALATAERHSMANYVRELLGVYRRMLGR